MPHVYENAEDLEGEALVGNGACVALVKKYTDLKETASWTEGVTVKGNFTLKKGTAIATFVNGRYPNNSTGNHAAFYISQDASGITVVDQWGSSGTIRKRKLSFKGQDKQSKYIDPSNNGDAFSVIE